MLADLDEQLARTAAQELRRRFRTDRVLHVRCDVTKERDIESKERAEVMISFA